jgi:hypothetical protein
MWRIRALRPTTESIVKGGRDIGAPDSADDQLGKLWHFFFDGHLDAQVERERRTRTAGTLPQKPHTRFGARYVNQTDIAAIGLKKRPNARDNGVNSLVKCHHLSLPLEH